MKSQKVPKLGAAILAFALALTMFVTPAFAISSGDKGTIAVNGVEDGVAVSAYRLMDVNYDYTADQPKDPVYKWVAAMQTWVDANFPEYSDANAFNVTTVDADKAKEFYDKLAVGIKAHNPGLTAANTRTGSGTIANLEMGNYFILIENGMKVYRPSAVNLVPTWNTASGKWEMTSPATVEVKATEPGIEKSANDGNKVNAGIGDIVNYDIRSMVPTYPENATAKGYQISDKMSAGLTFQRNTLKVYGVAADGTETPLRVGTDYTLAVPGHLMTDNSATTFTVDMVYDNIKTYTKIHVDYDAMINKNAIDNPEGIENAANLEYNNNPYDDTSWKNMTDTDNPDTPDHPKVFTYGIDLTKVNNAGDVLAGAKFKLADADAADMTFIKISDGVYRLAEPGEAGASAEFEVGANGAVKGKLTIKGIKVANYTLTETVAPDGYNKLQNPVALTLTDANTDGSLESADGAELNSQYLPVSVTNNQGFELPVTGGAGTLLFTVGGVLLIGGALVLIVALRKKKSHEA